jgi:transposase
MENVYHVGLDVHKETIEISVFLNWGQTPEFEKTVINDHSKIVQQLKKLQRQGMVKVCYEAGCMGYTLQRILCEAGIDCRVVSPGKIPRKPTDWIKTDRRDARHLAKCLRSGEAEGIYIPTPQDEATRDYLRARDDLKLDLKRAKQQLLKFLLRHGFQYDTNSYWTKKHRVWMQGLKFTEPLQHEAFQVYYTRICEIEERMMVMEARIIEIAESDHYRTSVGLLRCLKGVDYLIALAMVCEVGDFRRFKNAGAFMAYLGLIPREYSSGEKRKQGGITKSGNGHLRRLLVEASWHYRYQSAPSRRLTTRRVGQDTKTIAYADKAMRRLQKKFLKLIHKGKSKNVAAIAIARELSGFIWGMMNDKMAM